MDERDELLAWIDARIERAKAAKLVQINRGAFVDAVCARDYEAFLREFRRKFIEVHPEPISWSPEGSWATTS